MHQRTAEKCHLHLACVLQAAQFEAEYQAVRREAEEASGRDKSLLEAKAGKVKTKLDDALSKVTAIEVAPLPKVEVRRTGQRHRDSTLGACKHSMASILPATFVMALGWCRVA